MQKHVQCGDIYNQAGHYYPRTAIGLWVVYVFDIALAWSPIWPSLKVCPLWNVHTWILAFFFLVRTQFVYLCTQTIGCLVHKYATFAPLFKISMLTLALLRCLMRSTLSWRARRSDICCLRFLLLGWFDLILSKLASRWKGTLERSWRPSQTTCYLLHFALVRHVQ